MFESSEHTHTAIDVYLKHRGRKSGQFLFPDHSNQDSCLSIGYYARLLSQWLVSIGQLVRRLHGIHSMDQFKTTNASVCTIIAVMYAFSTVAQAGSGSATFNVGATVVAPGAGSTDAAIEEAKTGASSSQLRYTCGAALINVERNGFRSVRSVSCSENRYQFKAIKAGQTYVVTVNATGGQITSVAQSSPTNIER